MPIPLFAQLLTPDQVERVHEASLEILREVGILVRLREAREVLVRHGCVAEASSELVRFPAAVVEEYLAACPPSFTFHGRDPQFDRTLPADGPLMVTGSSAPDVLDPATGQVRRSRSDDIARIAALVDGLPGYDVLAISVMAGDAKEAPFGVSRFYPALKNCLKPVRGSAPSLQEAQGVFRLCAEVAGSEAAFWARPFVTFNYCAMVSPLVMDLDSTEKLIRNTEMGLPCHGTIAPNAGMTAPLSLLGALAQGNAEFLAQTALVQMVRSGTPVLYDPLPTVADMRSGAYAPGGIETGILMMGSAQLARRYGVPCSGFVGLGNAKLNDAQSGYETGMSTVAAVLSGVDLLAMGGLLDALMVFDYAKLVIDGEIAAMLKRLARGLEFSEENLALEVIREVGPGRAFVDTRHTLRRARSEAFLPQVADRQSRALWLAAGAQDAEARALQRACDILRRGNPAMFAPEVDARIRAEFAALPPGDPHVKGTLE
jgi:trimethylamine--corrinoid protein Co-methyltransferase